MSYYSKVEVSINRIFFPKKAKELRFGNYGIVSCKLIKHLEGEVPNLNKFDTFTIKGANLPDLHLNQILTIELETESHDKKFDSYSYTVKTNFEFVEITTPAEKEKFLLQCLTEAQIKKLYESYDDPYTIIENRDTEALSKKGFSERSIESIYRRFDEAIGYAPIYGRYYQYGLTPNMIAKLVQHYGGVNAVLKILEQDIYTLAGKISQIGFKRVDTLALNSGVTIDDTRRLRAFIPFYLSQEASVGNSWIEVDTLVQTLYPSLGYNFSDKQIVDCFYELQGQGVIDWNSEKTRIYLTENYSLEKEIAQEIRRIMNGKKKYVKNKELEDTIIREIEENQGWNYTVEQKEAIDTILSNPISLLIGFAGAGKTSMIKAVTTILSKQGLKVGLCCLAGKASQRLSESTNFEAKTIHRLLEFNGDSGDVNDSGNNAFVYNKKNQLPQDFVGLDEASMVGAELFLKLISAIPDDSIFLLSGDTGQLESLGKGNIFSDMINCGMIPVCRLTKIHRQAAASGIISSSLKLRNNEYIVEPSFTGVKTLGELQDFTIDIYEDKELTCSVIMDWYNKLCPDLKATEDICVVLPMKNRSMACTQEINYRVQQQYNPNSPKKKELVLKRGNNEVTFRVGDKVINKHNYYNKPSYCNEEIEIDILNGYLGYIVDINSEGVVVTFKGYGTVLFDFDNKEVDTLLLGYAITCHSMQGSSCKKIITGIDYSHYNMLSCHMLYTAITRAEDQCILVAQRGALGYATRTNNILIKKTFLKDFLRKVLTKVI